ncbi:hypothetical protein RDI58_004577 [Solanum bulbocastanum]|uniref:Uncharacterized protein n=1 Tax=Solanum bulbocastanum TaxID=147425 RepID=A0AAN8U4T7_SOLBU
MTGTAMNFDGESLNPPVPPNTGGTKEISRNHAMEEDTLTNTRKTVSFKDILTAPYSNLGENNKHNMLIKQSI